MRRAFVTAILALALALGPAGQAQEPPGLVVALPLTFQYVAPGEPPQPIDGFLRIDFPPETRCAEPMQVSLAILEAPEFAQLTLDPASATLVPDAEGPSHTLPFDLGVGATADAPALAPLPLKVQAATAACGNLPSHQATASTQLTVQFRGRLEATLASTDSEAWTVRVRSESNGPAHVTASLVVPSTGQTVAQGERAFEAAGAEETWRLARSGLPKEATILAQFRIAYDGAADPDAIPTAFHSLVLQSAQPASQGPNWAWTGLAGVLLAAAAIGGLLWWRRR